MQADPVTSPELQGPPGGTLFQQILRSDLPASLVVFLIAIPLSLGIALASGAPIMAGLIAGVVGGIVAGSLGGAPLQVSGPAAGLTVIVYGMIVKFGWPITCAITVLAGLLQIAFGVLRIARGALAISPAVVHGMLAGIGITIALAQLHVVLGGSPESSALKNLHDLPDQILHLHGGATILGLLTIGLLMVWRYLPKQIRTIPAPLAAVAIATLVSVAFGMDVKRVDLPNNLFEDHVLPRMPQGDWGSIAVAAFTFALIASIESLLSAVAVDKLQNGPRAELDRELIGQGAANTVSGLLGGLPVTGVIVRSSANVNAGAQSRASAVLHGIWILLFVALLGSLIEKIPLAVLAGLLVHVGIQLVKPGDIRELNHHKEAPIYWITVAGVVGLNLLYGVGLGVALAVVMLLRRLAGLRISTESKGDRWHVRVEGSATFLAVPQLTKALAEVPPQAHVDVDLNVDFIDHAAFEALHNWRANQERMGGKVDIDETHEAWYGPTPEGRTRPQKITPVGMLKSLLLGRGRKREVPASSENSSMLAAPAVTVMDGVREFQREGASLVRPLLSQLARDGQQPTDLFIACSDSRVVPEMFTLSGPGDLFKIRNIGNLVPPSDSGNPAVGAAVEYALNVLDVPGIVICGHSGCGAMQALLKNADQEMEYAEHLTDWLTHGHASVARFNAGETLDPSLPDADQLSQVNVLQQIDNLMTYRIVQERYASGKLKIVGMFFNIETAQVYVLDTAAKRFRLVSDAEANIITELPDGVNRIVAALISMH